MVPIMNILTAHCNPVLPTEGLAGCFIDGEWHAPASEKQLTVENPSRRSTLAEVGRGGTEEVDQAVSAASRAFSAWRVLAARERGKPLLALAERIAEHTEDIARLLAAETGNALRTQARPEVMGTAEVLRYYGGAIAEQKGETLPLGPGIFSYSTREPHGVVGAIIPWNAPLLLGAMKLSMALATGNTLVLKPAEDAPLAVIRMTELAADLFPAGVFNLVTGVGEEAGAALARHPLVSKTSFTGSSEVGKLVAHAAADRIANVTLELGGKSPIIVYPDAASEDLRENTVDGIVAAMRFSRQGQSCTAGSRLFLHRDAWDRVMPRLAEKVGAMKMGDALDEANDIGAIINAERYTAVRDYVVEAIEQGAEVIVGGAPLPTEEVAGYFPPATILAGLDNTWRIAREEVFGPVLVAIPWSDEDDVLDWANDTHYGLAGYVFTPDVSTIMRVTQRLDAGWLQVNQGAGQIPGMSYGGTKQSGIGSEFSIEGALEAYTYRKSVTIGLGS
jgi:acyl-CoA reductase-like NAD-dependent aldehyde dehydrogenase